MPKTVMLVLVYVLVTVLPPIYLAYRHYWRRPLNPTITAEDPKKAPKSIMQPPKTDLAPPKDDPFTAEQLKEFDGNDPSKPIYVAIKGDIFDVSAKADSYGKGRSYHVFAGKDASRAFGKSSLKSEDAVADYSTLDDKERKVMEEWYSFFCKRYNIVGRVSDGPEIAS